MGSRPYDTWSNGDRSIVGARVAGMRKSCLGDRYRWALVVARPVLSSINLSLYFNGIVHKGYHYISLYELSQNNLVTAKRSVGTGSPRPSPIYRPYGSFVYKQFIHP